MKILLVHQEFPAQFKHLAPALKRRGDEVAIMCMNDFPDTPGYTVARSRPAQGSSTKLRWLRDFESKVIRGEASFETARALRADGVNPDVILAHPGWGESLFLKEVWPAARLGIYCEYYYRIAGGDLGFDPEFPDPDPEATLCRLKLRNLNNDLHFGMAAAGIAPTFFQADSFPAPFREKISVIHDGIDTQIVKPGAGATLRLSGGTTLDPGDEIVTFVSRSLEPMRGYHIFMRALPELLRRRPNAKVVIVGGDHRGYSGLAEGASWRERFLGEVADRIDPARVHFVGLVPHDQFRALLQMSTVHVYLTYPFVLSWSLLEAMASGCAIVGSDTAPVREMITHDATGRLFPFFDRERMIDEICVLLDDPAARQRLGANARDFVRAGFDAKTICVPAQLDWIDRLAAMGS